MAESQADARRMARAERIKEARLRVALERKQTVSQAKMAELIAAQLGRSLSQSQWSDYEIGITDPPYDVAEAAAAVSGLSPAYIAFGLDDDTPVGETSHQQPKTDLEGGSVVSVEHSSRRSTAEKGGGKKRRQA